MRTAVTCLGIGLVMAMSSPTLADVIGVIRGPDGRPVPSASVTSGEAEATSGPNGTFRLMGVDLPAEVSVEKSGYLPTQVTIERSPVNIVLLQLPAVTDDIAVEARQAHREQFAPAGFAASVLSEADRPVAPTALTDLVLAAPGVAENGQGGLFQVVSVRGLSRQRVLTRVAGIPMVAERRAGVSTSFVDPALLGDVAVVRGPVGVLYGTGVLGGVIEVWPRTESSLRAGFGWREGNDELSASVGGQVGDWSVALAHRQAGDDSDANGSRLFSGFEQTSLSLQGTLGTTRPLRLTAIASFADDIAKPNTLFPGEVTIYPKERHVALRLAGDLAPSWSWAVHAHPNDLVTETTTSSSRERVENDALDFGARTTRSWAIDGETEVTLAGEWFARRDVRALEEVAACNPGTANGLPAPTGCVVVGRGATLDRASLDELSLATTWERRFTRGGVHLGARGVWEQQDDRGVAATDAEALVAFIGANLQVGGGVEVSANLGTGARLASLSERLYSGLTGAGRIIGNPDLDPERSQNFELGVRHTGRHSQISAHLFRSEVDDFIERFEIEDGLFSYRNLTSGTIDGVEVEALGTWKSLRLETSWLSLRGEAADGRVLPDVPADRARMLVGWRGDRFDTSFEWIHRFTKDSFGSGEVARDASNSLTAMVAIAIGDATWISLAGENLLDELWFPSADRRASPAPGRTLKLAVRWHRS